MFNPDPVPSQPALGGAGLPLAMGGLQLVGNLIGAKQQERSNLKLAAYQAAANERYLDKYNAYNTPSMQMQRFKDAGLNPNLIYGQGNPGNQSSPLQYPEVRQVDYQQLFNVLPLINQTKMVESQVQAQNATTRQKTVMAELNELQKKVLARNPLLVDAGFEAIIDSLRSSAEIKASESRMKREVTDWFTAEKVMTIDGVEMHGPAGVLKMEAELKLLDQKYRLGELDTKIKAEVLNSKEFQNDIMAIQRKWMVDGEMTPQHFYQLIQALLLRAMSVK